MQRSAIPIPWHKFFLILSVRLKVDLVSFDHQHFFFLGRLGIFSSGGIGTYYISIFSERNDLVMLLASDWINVCAVIPLRVAIRCGPI